MPSGASGDWGSSPSLRATSRVDIRWMSAPSRWTVPCASGWIRPSALSSVDFPLPFGPMRVVIWPLGTVIPSPEMTSCLA